MKEEVEKLGMWEKLFISIPWLRRHKAKVSMKEELKDMDLLNTVNRMMSIFFGRTIIRLYNVGKFDLDTMAHKPYYADVVKKLFGKKAIPIVEQFRIERASVKSCLDFKIVMIYPPSNMEIGQNHAIAFVVNPRNKAYFYAWEWSVNSNKMICTYDEDKNHLNFGLCNDKVEFVKRIIELSAE